MVYPLDLRGDLHVIGIIAIFNIGDLNILSLTTQPLVGHRNTKIIQIALLWYKRSVVGGISEGGGMGMLE